MNERTSGNEWTIEIPKKRNPRELLVIKGMEGNYSEIKEWKGTISNKGIQGNYWLLKESKGTIGYKGIQGNYWLLKEWKGTIPK